MHHLQILNIFLYLDSIEFEIFFPYIKKQLIWEQLRKENERVKIVVIKRSY